MSFQIPFLNLYYHLYHLQKNRHFHKNHQQNTQPLPIIHSSLTTNQQNPLQNKPLNHLSQKKLYHKGVLSNLNLQEYRTTYLLYIHKFLKLFICLLYKSYRNSKFNYPLKQFLHILNKNLGNQESYIIYLHAKFLGLYCRQKFHQFILKIFVNLWHKQLQYIYQNQLFPCTVQLIYLLIYLQNLYIHLLDGLH